MAARLNPKHQEFVKAKIQGTQLINRLQNHALGKLKDKMTDSQVKAADILLRKIVSDAPKDVRLGDPNGQPLVAPQFIINPVKPVERGS